MAQVTKVLYGYLTLIIMSHHGQYISEIHDIADTRDVNGQERKYSTVRYGRDLPAG